MARTKSCVSIRRFTGHRLAVIGVALALGGCSYLTDDLWPTLTGDDPADQPGATRILVGPSAAEQQAQPTLSPPPAPVPQYVQTPQYVQPLPPAPIYAAPVQQAAFQPTQVIGATGTMARLNGAVTNALNMPSVTAEEAPRLKPYMTLAEQLGSFVGQITETSLKSVSVEYCGHVATLNTRPLTAVVLQGLLRPLMDSVNMVNAPLVAKERDIEVREIKRDGPCSYATQIRLTVTTERRTRDLAGTLFEARPRITEIKGISVEAELGPHMLYVTNQDKPGFIGSLGRALGDAGINIATFHLGRAAPGSDAIALVEVDQAVPAAVLKTVADLPHVVQVKALKF